MRADAIRRVWALVGVAVVCGCLAFAAGRATSGATATAPVTPVPVPFPSGPEHVPMPSAPGSAPPAGSSAGGPPVGTTATGPPPTTGPSTRSAPDLSRTTGPPPDGVAAQAEVYLGGEGFCTGRIEPGAPRVVVSTPADRPGVVEVPTVLNACLENFADDLDVAVEFIPSTGHSFSRHLAPPRHPDGYGVWVPLPTGMPFGPLGIVARQGADVAELTVTLAPPRKPRLLLVKPSFLHLGADLDLYLGGFPAGRAATLHLYGSLDEGLRQPYRTSFTVPVDSRGEAHVVIDTRPDDPPGCYGIVSPLVEDPTMGEPPARPGFCLSGRAR